jgi:hypothetical protein
MRMLTLALASLLLAAQAGCGRPSDSWILPPPPSEELRAQLGRVVVRSDGDLLAESVLTPAIAGVCGAMGCGLGAGVTLGVSLAGVVWPVFFNERSMNDPRWVLLPCLLVFAVAFVLFLYGAALAAGIGIGAVGGTIWGLSKAPSGEKIEKDRAILEKAVLAQRLSDRIKEAVVVRAARETTTSVAAWNPATPRDTILLISGPRVLLHGRSTFDAPLRLYVEVDVRLLGPDGTVLHSFTLGREGNERSIDSWVGRDGSMLAGELGHPETYAERIVEEIFVLVGVQARRPPRPMKGR